MKVKLMRSPLPTKKWRMVFPRIGHTDFGHPDYQDFTTHKDEARRAKFLNRFRGMIERYADDPTSPMTLSHLILWNKPTIEDSFRDYKKRFGLR